MKNLGGMLLAVVLGGCALTPDPPLRITRFNGSPVDPVTRERALTECQAKANVAQAQIPTKQNPSLLVAYTDAKYKELIGQDALVACMAEKDLKVTKAPI